MSRSVAGLVLYCRRLRARHVQRCVGAEQMANYVAAIDGLFFSLGRSVCLGTGAPECNRCSLKTTCQRRTDLFQPAFRTTAY